MSSSATDPLDLAANQRFVVVNVIKEPGQQPYAHGVAVATLQRASTVARPPRRQKGKIKLVDAEGQGDWTQIIEIPSVLFIHNPFDETEAKLALQKAIQNQEAIPLVFSDLSFGLVHTYYLSNQHDNITDPSYPLSRMFLILASCACQLLVVCAVPFTTVVLESLY